MNNIEWIGTTQKSQWQSKDQITVSAASNSRWGVEAYLDQPLQAIEAFGACFNELGCTSLNNLLCSFSPLGRFLAFYGFWLRRTPQ